MLAPPELVLDRYRVGSRLAAGAAGTVVGAVDTETALAVVVKFFDGSDDNFSAWVQEVRLALRLRHANIPACVNAGYDPAWGLSVLVFERALGGSLRRALVSGRRFTAEERRRVLADVAAALGHAHAQGVIHRDVKPENIVARSAAGGSPWQLIDFGAGSFLPRGAIARAQAGSLQYIAPEVMRTGGVAASDQYSLGMVGAEMRTGSLPGRRERSTFRLRHGDGEGLDRVIARLLEPDPERRFPGIEAAAAALANGGRFDVTATRDGCHYARVGVDVLVRRPGRSTLEHVGHVPGAGRFLNAWGDGAAVLATDDRLIALSPFARTIGAAPPRRIFVADAAQGSLWSLEEAGLGAGDRTGMVSAVAVAVPPAWRGEKTLLGIDVGAGRAVLGVRGSDVLAWVERDGAAVRARLEPAPGPLHDLRRVGGQAVALCGDEDGAVVSAVMGGELREIARCAHAVDTLRIEAESGRLEVIALAPALVCVTEDDG